MLRSRLNFESAGAVKKSKWLAAQDDRDVTTEVNDKKTTHECDAAADSAHVRWGSAAHGGYSAYAEN
jgi:hypothetical protein